MHPTRHSLTRPIMLAAMIAVALSFTACSSVQPASPMAPYAKRMNNVDYMRCKMQSNCQQFTPDNKNVLEQEAQIASVREIVAAQQDQPVGAVGR